MTSDAPQRDGHGILVPAHQPVAVGPARPESAPNEQDETGTVLVQTQTACLLMTGSLVLKWKKPVDLGFVDFSSRADRVLACQHELDLNRRLAGDVYLGVGEALGPEDIVQEPYLLMRRLPARLRLTTLIRQGRPVLEHVDALARLLADFHSSCDIPADAATLAAPARLRRLWQEALAVLREHAPAVAVTADLHLAITLVDGYLLGRTTLLRERVQTGRVRDGHGDLLADDVFCLPDGPRVLDCLDVDPQLRCGDVVADVAFLAMDLEHLGDVTAAHRLWEQYRLHSGEHHPQTLVHFYTAYRAAVRAKVCCLRADQLPPGGARASQLREAADLAGLALRHLEQTRVTLTLLGGLPGSGKSTLAEAVTAVGDSTLLSSDLVRHELRGHRVDRDDQEPHAGPEYAAETTDEVYRTMLHRARIELARGVSVVLDASWTTEAHRRAARALATETSSVLIEVQCQVTDDVAAARTRERGPAHDAHATAAVRTAMRVRTDAWPTATCMDTAGPLSVAVAGLTALTGWRPPTFLLGEEPDASEPEGGHPVVHVAARASNDALRCTAEAYEASARALFRRPAAARRQRALARGYRQRIST